MTQAHSSKFLTLVHEAKGRIQEIDVSEYRRMVNAGEPHTLIDVREDSEWQAGHVSGAVHLGKGIIERDIEGSIPDVHRKLILYCGGGYRSALAADALRQMGYSQAISLDGGWRALQESGLPLAKG